MKNWLATQRFDDDKELHVTEWLRSQGAEFYDEGISKSLSTTMAFIQMIETEKKIRMVSTYLYSCSDSSNAQPPHDKEIPSPTSSINRV
ncbi:hypothetical protein TNCV_2374361 [Trichonephila clavipes]|nr:hypothetical protein TNCV_2374361 [Trichonephila clavipes]